MGISGGVANGEAPRGWALVLPPEGLQRPLLVRPSLLVLPLLLEALASITLAMGATHVLPRRQQRTRRRQGQKRQRFQPQPWRIVRRRGPVPTTRHQQRRR